VAIVLWALLGLIRSRELGREEAGDSKARPKNPPPNAWRRFARLAAIGLIGGALLFFPSLLAFRGGVFGAQAAQAMTGGDYRQAMELLEQAVSNDPLQSSYHCDLAQARTAVGLQELRPLLLVEAAEDMKRAIRLKPYDPRIRLAATRVYLLQDRWPEAYEQAVFLAEINPLDINSYEAVARASIALARYQIQLGRSGEAQDPLQRVLALRQQIEERSRGAKPAQLRMWQGERLQVTPAIVLCEGQAAYLAGDMKTAGEKLDQAIKLVGGDKKPEKQLIRQEAEIWKAALLKRTQRADEAAAIIKRLAAELAQRDKTAAPLAEERVNEEVARIAGLSI
ncbi:MAG: hypothetical protein QHH02_08000, partial [Syntrophomonadaceae bacterium]|nr:hypothetical protein [Syntrophomonadaceae bacterium]